ncbi:MAG: hypothetical protein JWN48_4736 [Myxococcaceae bacterium]|nr:hypothetical protein [Myxococcaceae bacterium]
MGVLSCWALSVWLVAQVAPALTLSPLAGFAVAYLAVTAEILSLAALAPGLAPRVAGAACALGMAGLIGLSSAPSSAPYAAVLTFVLGGTASLLGATLGARIEQPGQLVAVASVSAIADLWSVFDRSAPSARFAEQVLSHPERLALFALPYPLLGSDLTPAVIGAGDVAFAALYVAAFRAHGLSLWRVNLALAAAFLAGLMALLITLRPLPLLPLLGLAVVASEPAARSLTRREWRTVLVVCAAMIGAIVVRISR